MKFWIQVSVALVFAGFVLSIFNILSGLKLVDRASDLADAHLIRAIALLASVIFGESILLAFSLKELDAFRGRLLSNPTLEVDYLRSVALRQRAFNFAVGSLVLSLVGLISGTISNAGSFPVVHGLIGFILPASLASSAFLWIQFFSSNKKRK